MSHTYGTNQRPFGCLADLSDSGVMLGSCPGQCIVTVLVIC